MMRLGLGSICRSSNAVAASSSRRFAVASKDQSSGQEKEKSTREAIVKTPSLQKEMKLKDMFNAAKEKETESGGDAAGDSSKERAYGSAQPK